MTLAYRILLLFLLLGNIIHAQVRFLGYPEITTYSSQDFKGDYDCWSISQDLYGTIYVGNTNILMFNGEDWLKIENKNTIRQYLPVDSSRVYFAGNNEIGYIERDALGRRSVHSLVDKIPDQFKKKYWVIHYNIEQNNKGEIFFLDNYKLHIWNNDTFKIIPFDFKPNGMFSENGDIYITSNKGIYKWQEGSLVLLDQFSNSFSGVQFSKGVNYNGNRIIPSRSDFYYLKNDSIIKLTSKIHDRLGEGLSIRRVITYKDLLVVGSLRKGLYFFDPDFNLVFHLDENSGLQGLDIRSLYTDNQDNIWVTHSNGISCIHLKSGITTIDDRLGLSRSSILGVAPLYNNTLYIQSNSGVYTRKWEGNMNVISPEHNFQSHPIMISQTWGNIIKNDRLLISNNTNTFQLSESAVSIIGKESVWKFIEVPEHEDYLLAGLYDGFELLAFKSGSWSHVRLLEGFKGNCHHFDSDNSGNIWVNDQGTLYKIKLDETLMKAKVIATYTGGKAGLPIDRTYRPIKLENELLFLCEDNIYRYNSGNDTFEPDTIYSPLINDSLVTQLVKDFKGNIWYRSKNKLGILKLNNDGSYNDHFRQFNSILPKYKTELFPIDNQNLLIGTETGLLHFNYNSFENVKDTFNCLINKVYIGQRSDSTIYWGGKRIFTNKDKISFVNNNMKFKYAATFFEKNDQLLYQFKLDGLQTEWSDWSKTTYKEYNNLPAGNYDFIVRAKSVYGDLSSTSHYKFTIAKPWYLEWFVTGPFVAVILLSIGFIYYLKNNELKFANQSLVEKNLELVQANIASKDNKTKFQNSPDYIENLLQYEGSSLSEDHKKEIQYLIEKSMEEEKLFLDPDLNIVKLSKHINKNKTYVSQVINDVYNKNFKVFINEYRIIEARKLLSDEKNWNLTIESIANMAGFKSKSAFNPAFKKYIGLTPSYYLNSVKTSKKAGN